ncbi:unnamed protein product [Prunus armeniaca]|uniref:Uncharacterized protein n=1 Tax=Prunus armeniaca TaxID=36596 RepID=A0A6J5VMQ8_PRUAR|nr:unnamed protein product [Prunus armeniaca]
MTQRCHPAIFDYGIDRKMTSYFWRPCLGQGPTSPVPHDAEVSSRRENEGLAFRRRFQWSLTSIKGK